MTTFESDKVLVKAPCEDVFSFLSDFRKLEQLMPEQIVNWNASEDRCSFSIQGMADLSMRLASKSECRNIHIVSEGNNPIDYSMDYYFRKMNDSACEVTVVLDAELNTFLKSVASKPLKNLVDMIASKLKDVF